MNNTIDDFFNEISDLEQSKQSKQNQSVWQECYDELTGYSYYWNTKTDEVTWTTPADFKSVKDQKKGKMSPRKKELYVPPRAAPVLPSTSAKVSQTSIKIYSIGDNSKKKFPPVQSNKAKTVENRKSEKKPFRRDSDSEDEKIELISSYGGDTESESEESDLPIQNDVSEKTKGNDSNLSDDDDVDILTKIQKRAKELKEMGGDLPPELANVVDAPKNNGKPSPEREKKSASSFSLVAGYSDSEEEQESEEVKSIFPIPPEPPKVAHSTLFPITKPIDVKDFLQPPESKVETPNNDFDSKAFQRKRRIGVALVNTGKKKEENLDELETEARGLGFKSEDATTPNTKDNIYAGFRKGGVMFVKSDVLNPSLPKTDDSGNVETKTEEVSNVKQADLEEVYSTLMEKLGFLSEGRPLVSPVQIMSIQAETLFTAMKENGLKPSYLQRWLNNTHADLNKLEKDAAPEGWLLQWDRSHKRYYYQNQTTGESQWEYPQPDISRCDEAMDISTTPPPAEPTIHLSPPLPPIIRSPTPPPPPIISRKDEEDVKTKVPDVPLPPEPVAPAKFLNDGEPLPPGVDLPEIIAYNKPKEKEAKTADPLFSALDSFYSDIASMENPNSSSPPPPPPPAEDSKALSDPSVEPPKKKKKTKVKLAPGLAMKKKGVSQLVEKWKNVQQHYND
ncbi:formin-binding protein 4 [Anoplophora glabripennis]|uniref:formin-binding protein 4 n=1 Tax=Anoplophora glabripennis TaxID=217634 RepID=UPI0008758683|nr:formin-binding protein 4 [Anoplophora glabripennis]